MRRRVGIRTFRGRMLLGSAAILGIMMTAMLFTGFFTGELARSVELLFNSNLIIKDIRQVVEKGQDALGGYLRTKSSEDLREYILQANRLNEYVGRMAVPIHDHEVSLLHRGLSRALATWVTETEACVRAKRGRDVSQYPRLYNNAARIRGTIEWYLSQIDAVYLEESLGAWSLFNEKIPQVVRTNTLLIISATLFGFSLLYTYAWQLTYPLSRLAEAARKVGDGEYDNELPSVEREDEIGTMTLAFAHMQANVRSMFAELKHKAELERRLFEENVRSLDMEHKLKDAELLALQTQINPHFLFNTLAAGQHLSLMEGAPRTTDFLENLAEFMRYALKNPTRLVRLAEELECVRQYIWLLRLRFGDRHAFNLHVEPGVEDLYCPALMLQPLVENSVGHGLHDRESGGLVTIRVRRDPDGLRLEVEDNGVGMSEERVTRIQAESLDEHGLPHAHIGLHNVIRRISLATAGHGRVVIRSEPGRGTRVEVILPLTGEAP